VSGYEMRAFRTTVDVDSNLTLGWLEIVMAELREIPEAHAFYTASSRELVVIIDTESDYYHGRSPAEPHGWCHGWIVRGIMEFMRDSFSQQGYTLEWEVIDWLPSLNRVLRVHKDEEIGFSLHKVPLRENELTQ
jgi:hypothetical protein